MKGDYYELINPKLEAFVKKVIAPIEVTSWKFFDLSVIYHFDTSERIPDPKRIEKLIQENISEDLELWEPKEGSSNYRILSYHNPGPEAMVRSRIFLEPEY